MDQSSTSIEIDATQLAMLPDGNSRCVEADVSAVTEAVSDVFTRDVMLTSTPSTR